MIFLAFSPLILAVLAHLLETRKRRYPNRSYWP